MQSLACFLLWEVLQRAAVFKAVVSETVSASFCVKQKNETRHNNSYKLIRGLAAALDHRKMS